MNRAELLNSVTFSTRFALDTRKVLQTKRDGTLYLGNGAGLTYTVGDVLTFELHELFPDHFKPDVTLDRTEYKVIM